MDYQTAAEILDRHIFDGDKVTLLRNIADRPERFTGFFRPTKPKAKILQNLLQSHEIRFGDAMEELITQLIHDLGYKTLPERTRHTNGDKLSLDQYFTDGTKYYFVEQKVRDDHDSTKKRGQSDNFERKLDTLRSIHGPRLVGIMYFIDPELQKNKNFYSERIKYFSDFYGIELYLHYGSEFFSYFGQPSIWDNLLKWLQEWKESLPDLPEINLDNNAKESFLEIKDIEIRIWRKLIVNDKIWDDAIMYALFNKGRTLKYLVKHFQSQSSTPYLRLAQMLKERLDKYYPEN